MDYDSDGLESKITATALSFAAARHNPRPLCTRKGANSTESRAKLNVLNTLRLNVIRNNDLPRPHRISPYR